MEPLACQLLLDKLNRLEQNYQKDFDTLDEKLDKLTRQVRNLNRQINRINKINENVDNEMHRIYEEISELKNH